MATMSQLLPVKFGALPDEALAAVVQDAQVLDLSALRVDRLVPILLEREPAIGPGPSLLASILRSRGPIRVGANHLVSASRMAAELLKRPRAEVLASLQAHCDIREFSLVESVSSRDFVYTKINHRCWEEISIIGMQLTGQEYFRNLGPVDQPCIDSGFYDLLAACLAACARTRRLGRREVEWCRPDFAFGVSLTGGNARVADDLAGTGRDVRIIKELYPAVTVGAAAGLIGFLSQFAGGAGRWRVADGSMPKSLFWQCQLGEFLRRIVEDSEAVLFIVPPWLAGATIPNRPNLKVYTLVVPGQEVDTLWSLVAPMALQWIAELSRRHRLTVLCQCSALSAILGMLTHLYWAEHEHLSPARYYDLGQLLDLANLSGTDIGFWLTREDVRSHAMATDDWSHLLNMR